MSVGQSDCHACFRQPCSNYQGYDLSAKQRATRPFLCKCYGLVQQNKLEKQVFAVGLGLMLLPNMFLLPVAFIALIGLVKSLVRAVDWYEFRGRDMQRKSAAFAFVWFCVAVLTMPFAGGYAPVRRWSATRLLISANVG